MSIVTKREIVINHNSFKDNEEDTEHGKNLLHKDAHEDGGIALNDKQMIELQQQAVKEWLQAIGKKIMKGQINLLNTTFPVKIFEARSYLQKMADSWNHTRYLHHAATAVDLVDRMKMVIAWYISGSNHSFERWGKPFNPILGETWQATLNDGTLLNMEQISHRPPITAFQMVGPQNLFVFEGTSQPSLQVIMSSYGFKSTPKGKKMIRFQDGGEIHMKFASYLAKGVATAPRAHMTGTACFVDLKNQLVGEIVYGPVKGSEDPLLKRLDSFQGHIYKVGPSSQRLDLNKNQQTIAQSFSSMFASSTKMWGRFYRSPSETNTTNQQNTEESDDDDDDSASVPSGPQSGPIIENEMTKQQQFQQAGKQRRQSDRGDEEEKVLSSFTGSWCSHLDFDGERFWTLKKERFFEWIPDNKENRLPSDCSFREDLMYLRQGDQETAQIWKTKLEEKQRADRKLRPTTDFE